MDVPHVVSGTHCFSFLLAELESGVFFSHIYFKRVILYVARNTVPDSNPDKCLFLFFLPFHLKRITS